MRAHTAHATFATKPMLRRVARSIQTRITATGCRKQTRSSRIFFTLPNLPGARGVVGPPGAPGRPVRACDALGRKIIRVAAGQVRECVAEQPVDPRSEGVSHARSTRVHRKASVGLFGGCGVCLAEC